MPGGVPSSLLLAQGSPPPSPLMLITRDGRRAVPTTVVSGQELIGLDDVATLFQVMVREDALAGGVTLTYRGRTIVASADQPMASVNGRVVTLPSPVVRSGRRFLVPVEFLSRALAPIYDQRIELRRPQRLLLVGDVRVPRVTARIDSLGPPTHATIDVAPQTTVGIVAEAARVLVRVDGDALDLSLPATGAGLIEQIRAGDQQNTVTVVLNAAAGMPRVAQTTSDGTTHVTIEVPAGAAAAPPPTDTAAAPRPSPPPAAPDASLTQPRTGFQTVVIDPGHGGDDRGAKGARGLEEKAFTLDIARRLRGLLEGRMGVRVVLTRDDDRAVPLDARAAIANSSKANLFLSLHVNASLASSLTGAEVYHLQLDREGEEARRQAEADAVITAGARRPDATARSDPLGPRAGAPRGRIRASGFPARRGTRQAGEDEPARRAEGAIAGTGRRRHPGSADRDALRQQRRPGEGGRHRRFQEHAGPGAIRRHRPLPRVQRRPERPMRKRGIQISVLLVTLGLLAWAVTIGLQRLAAPPSDVTPPPAPPAQPTAHITATLFYAAADGQQLCRVVRRWPLADGVVAQGRQILVAQLAPPPDGQRSVIPAGTQLRAFYVTGSGRRIRRPEPRDLGGASRAVRSPNS